ncbi:hypothetical protein RXV86_08545 [Alisedimentitalea sp. MJ-SS2]|uniref:hypothetical protein n=1 Tax=Aliisedimentitalea sp. MJ-SS2 TaxID=3049795 RepID=UPI0029140D96|nr:hypothetical protein [Alisedimentitalea sp. MJ-SS2]MDU8927429.1 hypothetical protein [Alisedimentitalea sp. MJ-SS2]
MRYFLFPATLVALAACEPTVPDSGSGVGFGDYDSYQQQRAARDAQLQGQAVPPAGAISGEASTNVGAPQSAMKPQGAAADVAADTQAVLDATRVNSGQKPVDASPSNPAPAAVLNPAGISKENDFNAVGAQRSIEDDAQRRAALKAQYQQVEVTAVPKRSGSSGPSIVEYALKTSHPVGQSIYRRVGINMQARYQKNCAKYPSPDLAQSEFLAKGGPQKDRLGLDPDGDGYACSWNPAPFRAARQSG